MTPRGFGTMEPDERRRLAALGGRHAHQEGRAHQWTVAEARAAGRRGGLARAAKAAARRQAQDGATNKPTV